MLNYKNKWQFFVQALSTFFSKQERTLGAMQCMLVNMNHK